MVHRMDHAGDFSPESENSCRKTVTVKMEDDDFAAGEYLCNKRPKFNLPHPLCNSISTALMAPQVECNPLEEPSPLGLKLKKSPSFLELIQMRLSQENCASLSKTLPRKEKGEGASLDKLKASNFPATFLRIGSWEYKSRYEGDLVAKCYFAKHKLVWEVLDGGLKNKIEIQWSDITAIKANYPDDGPGTIDIVLARQPLFFREINPQPRKHTLWQATSDFTCGQATIHRRHFLQCAQGLLGKHFEKLIQCDPRLNFLSQKPEIALETPYFEPVVSTIRDSHESDIAFKLKIETGSASSSKIERQDPWSIPHDVNSQANRSPISGTFAWDTTTTNSNSNRLDLLSQIKLPGLHPSMSMTDLVTHIGQRVSDQMMSDNPGLTMNEEQKQNILEDIASYLLTDSLIAPVSDEKHIMSRVNSLCCLLQVKPDAAVVARESWLSPSRGDWPGLEVGSEVEESAMSRKDSVGDLLLHLPRIASLP